MTEWQSTGRRLALEMSELKECSSLSGTLTPLGRLLTDPTLRRTSRDAEEAIASLEERASPLRHLDHVRLDRSPANTANLESVHACPVNFADTRSINPCTLLSS